MHKVLNDYPTVLAVNCPLFCSNNFLSSSDQFEMAPEHFGPTGLLQSLNDFCVIDHIFSACICFILYTNEAKL